MCGSVYGYPASKVSLGPPGHSARLTKRRGMCGSVYGYPASKVSLGPPGHSARLTKEGGCVDLSMDTLHLKYPLVLLVTLLALQKKGDVWICLWIPCI